MTDYTIEEFQALDSRSDIPTIISVAQEIGADDYVDDWVDDEVMDMIVKEEAKNGWQRVAHFLADVEYLNDDFYLIDGYGNARNITNSDVENTVSDIIVNYEDEFADSDEDYDEAYKRESIKLV